MISASFTSMGDHYSCGAARFYPKRVKTDLKTTGLEPWYFQLPQNIVQSYPNTHKSLCKFKLRPGALSQKHAPSLSMLLHIRGQVTMTRQAAPAPLRSFKVIEVMKVSWMLELQKICLHLSWAYRWNYLLDGHHYLCTALMITLLKMMSYAFPIGISALQSSSLFWNSQKYSLKPSAEY